MNSKMWLVIGVGAVALAIAAAVFGLVRTDLWRGKELPEKPQSREKPSVAEGAKKTDVVKKDRKDRKRKDKEARKDKKPGQHKKVKLAVEDTWTPEEHALADAVQGALDDDDLAKTRVAAAAAMASTNAEVRLEAVNALGWYGDKALVDLTKAMTDGDPDVAEAARGHVEQALTGMDDPHMAFVLASEYMKSFSGNPDTVIMLLGIMDTAGTQIVDPDDPDSPQDVEKARGCRADIVTALSDLIEQGGKTAEAAKKTYESIVGEPWTGADAAETWVDAISEPKTDINQESETESEPDSKPTAE